MNKEEKKEIKTLLTTEYRTKLIKTITDRAEACKKIKADTKKEIEPLVKDILTYIDYFNELVPYQATTFDFMSLNEVKVLPEFAFFVHPKSVRLIPGNVQSKDLLIKEKSGIVNPNYQDYLNAIIKWRNLFKKDISDAVTLDSLKADKSFADIMPKAGYVDDKGQILVRFDSTPFIPVPVAGSIASLFENGYLNSTYTEVVDYYFKTVLF